MKRLHFLSLTIIIDRFFFSILYFIDLFIFWIDLEIANFTFTERIKNPVLLDPLFLKCLLYLF